MNSLKGMLKGQVGMGIPVLNLKPLTITATRSINAGASSYIRLNHASVLIALTLDAPKIGHVLVISQMDTGTAGHTVTMTSGTYDGSNTILTFNAANETVVLFGVSATRWVIVENIGSVALS